MEQTVNENFCVELQKSPRERLSEVEDNLSQHESQGQRKDMDVEVQDQTMLIYFLSIGGIFRFEFEPKRAAVIKTFYVELLKHFLTP
jgi:hypothetical protein